VERSSPAPGARRAAQVKRLTAMLGAAAAGAAQAAASALANDGLQINERKLDTDLAAAETGGPGCSTGASARRPSGCQGLDIRLTASMRKPSTPANLPRQRLGRQRLGQ